MRVLVAIDGSGLAVDFVADAAWPAGTEILVAEAIEFGVAADRPPAGRASTRAWRDDRRYRRVAVVVDKDHAAVVLAEAVDADALLLLTDVAAVHLGWGTVGPGGSFLIGRQSIVSMSHVTV